MAERTQFSFGCHAIFATDAAGRTIKIAEGEGITIEPSTEIIPVLGAKGYPIDMATGKREVKVKLSSLVCDNDAIALVLGAVETASAVAPASETITAYTTGTEYELANAAELAEILRVLDANGDEMTLVEGAVSATGYYAEAAGTLTFNASEPVGQTVDYTYTDADGYTQSVVNGDQGIADTFIVRAWDQTHPVNGMYVGIELPKVALGKVGLSAMIGKSAPTEIEGEACADANGVVIKRYYRKAEIA